MKLSRLSDRLARMPMLRAVVPFAAGIALADRFLLPGVLVAAAFLIAGALALALRSQTATLALLLAAGFGTAQLRPREAAVPVGVHTVFELSVEGIPAERGRYRSAEAIVTAWRDPATGRWYASGDRAMLYADSLTPLRPGERLRCRGVLRPLRGGDGSYRRLMARRGFEGTFWLGERSLLERIPARKETLHFRAAERLGRLEMPPEAGAVCRAMAVGDRSGLTPALRDLYARSGFSHLLAVSGLHTGVVFALVNLLLWWLPLLRRGHLLRNFAAAALVWLYVAAAGFPPSAVRAAAMCTMLQFALASASEYVALNALSAAAFGMLLYNPAWLGDISFQLSFIAVGAILAWGVPLCRRFRTRWRAVNLLVDSFAVGFAASAATAPLISHTFGLVPLAGILLNPPAVLLASVVVLAGMLWVLLPFAPLAPVFEFVLAAATDGIHALAGLAEAVPGGTLEYALGTGPTAGLYLLFVLATAAAWSREPDEGVRLPAPERERRRWRRKRA